MLDLITSMVRMVGVGIEHQSVVNTGANKKNRSIMSKCVSTSSLGRKAVKLTMNTVCKCPSGSLVANVFEALGSLMLVRRLSGKAPMKHHQDALGPILNFT